MAKENPSLRIPYSSSVLGNMWSVLCIDKSDGGYKPHPGGVQMALSHAALAQVREDIAARILEGKQVFEKALQRTEIAQFDDAALNEDHTYSEQVRSIVGGSEELREVRKSFKAKLPQRPVEPAPAPTIACATGGLFSSSSKFQNVVPFFLIHLFFPLYSR